MLLPELCENDRKKLLIPTPKQFMMFSVPAILYTINNNLVVHIQAYVDPASFQVEVVLYLFAIYSCQSSDFQLFDWTKPT